MTMRRSLYRLEQNTPKDSNELLPHLCRLAGKVDSILWPARFQTANNFTAITLAQKQYFSEGVSFTLEGGSVASWKASERLRGSLVEEGWAESMPAGKLKMTLQGDTIARRSCGLPWIGNEFVIALHTVLGELPGERPGGWVSESSLFGCGWDWTDSGQWQSFTEYTLPLIIHRTVEATSSTVSRVFYRRLADTLPSVECEAEYSEKCLDLYSTAYCTTMSLRRGLEYSGSDLVVPLSATR